MKKILMLLTACFLISSNSFSAKMFPEELRQMAERYPFKTTYRKESIARNEKIIKEMKKIEELKKELDNQDFSSFSCMNNLLNTGREGSNKLFYAALFLLYHKEFARKTSSATKRYLFLKLMTWWSDGSYEYTDGDVKKFLNMVLNNSGLMSAIDDEDKKNTYKESCKLDGSHPAIKLLEKKYEDLITQDFREECKSVRSLKSYGYASCGGPSD